MVWKLEGKIQLLLPGLNAVGSSKTVPQWYPTPTICNRSTCWGGWSRVGTSQPDSAEILAGRGTLVFSSWETCSAQFSMWGFLIYEVKYSVMFQEIKSQFKKPTNKQKIHKKTNKKETRWHDLGQEPDNSYSLVCPSSRLHAIQNPP